MGKPSREVLNAEYQTKTDAEIALQYGVSATSVRRWRKDFGILGRPRGNRGFESRYSEENLRGAVKESISVAEVMRRLGIKPAGGSHTNISRRIRRLGLDTSHFFGQRANLKLGKNAQRKSADEILVLRESGYRTPVNRLIRALEEIGRAYQCEKCGNSGVWLGEKIKLQVDHKNGNWLDDRPENLRILCPNCHTQTPRWCGRKSRGGGTRQTRGV